MNDTTINPLPTEAPFVRSRFNYDRDLVSLETGLDFTGEPTRTQQQFKEETDINVLVRRFALTGELPAGVRMPTYEDFSEVYDFHSAANAIAEANEAFMQMPAEWRYRFGNDPAQFVKFCSNEENRAEAEKMGLVKSKIPLNTAPPPAPPSTPAVGAGDNGSAGGST